MNALVFNQLSKSFDGKNFSLKKVEFSVKERSFFGLLGLNGAGKSTLIKILSTLILPSSGKISLFDIENIFEAPQSARMKMGIVPQEINLPMFETVEETLKMEVYFYGINKLAGQARINLLMEALDLNDVRKKRIGALSGGMKRKVMLARALIANPQLLILDEPTAGLDIEARKKVWQILSALNHKGMTILLTSHYLEEIEVLCTDIALLNKGQLLFNQPKDVLLKKTAAPIGWNLHFCNWPIDAEKKITDLKGFLYENYTIYIENKNLSGDILDYATKLQAAGFIIDTIEKKMMTLEKLLLDLQQ